MMMINDNNKIYLLPTKRLCFLSWRLHRHLQLISSEVQSRWPRFSGSPSCYTGCVVPSLSTTTAVAPLYLQRCSYIYIYNMICNIIYDNNIVNYSDIVILLLWSLRTQTRRTHTHTHTRQIYDVPTAAAVPALIIYAYFVLILYV